MKDSIGQTWQCGTIQLDFQLPQRFDIEYIGADGAKHRPIMIHRAIFGLIEHYAGNFPVWLAPVQVKLLPISDKYLSYADAVLKALKAAGIRVEIDTRDEKLGYKIREARLDKVPFMAKHRYITHRTSQLFEILVYGVIHALCFYVLFAI